MSMEFGYRNRYEREDADHAALKATSKSDQAPFCYMSETYEVGLFTEPPALNSEWGDMFPVYRTTPDAHAQIEELKGELLGADALHEAEIAMHNKTKEKKEMLLDRIDTLEAAGHRLALELECLIMDTKDLPIQSRWWESSMEALEEWRQLFPYNGPRLGD
jgi:hypothetical protein